MTMVRRDTLLVPHVAGVAGTLLVITWLVAGFPVGIRAEQPAVHYPHAGAMVPGAIGRLALQRGGPLSGFFQPIEIRAPQGVQIAFAAAGAFAKNEPTPTVAGLQVASVYRIRVTRIPYHAGLELFPTVELIDRLHPPAGEAWRFPVPVELTQQELEFALDGRFVTRVIYVEDPFRAIPHAEVDGQQATFEVATGDSPLEVASRLGRPIAILRIGGRVPVDGVPDAAFLFGSPPLLRREQLDVPEAWDSGSAPQAAISHPAMPRIDLTPQRARAVLSQQRARDRASFGGERH